MDILSRFENNTLNDSVTELGSYLMKHEIDLLKLDARNSDITPFQPQNPS